ncbi:Card1-like endonuclease domain-containing protein [Dictyobacter arantiisoli]|uniref:Card1-like endonuclease domain-containing protein n=1 Tax=Dictyobacter arantiisoli TaxID=2014874 RepID=UPI003530A888
MGTGDWLEFYVWNEIINAGLADERHCQWGCHVLDGNIEREFDLALIYKAQLIVAECKAEYNPFKAEKQYLHKLAAKANVLGGSYVGKVFITNQPGTGDSIKSFREQAEQYQILIVTKEQLPDIARIMEQEAKNPKYRRI